MLMTHLPQQRARTEDGSLSFILNQNVAYSIRFQHPEERKDQMHKGISAHYPFKPTQRES